MNRNELLLLGLGGGGGRLVNTILNKDPRFQGFFVNTSMTDLESLSNLNKTTKNFLCISTQNGVGRDREVGKEYASANGFIILDLLEKYQQETIYLVSSLGGGSGSAILSKLLNGIKMLQDDGDFNKTINLIGILPDLKSPDVILKNTLATWNEIIDNSAINSMIFINNDVYSDIIRSANENEEAINDKFATLFDSIFYIPEENGINFDNGNLSNILKDKGCLYIYDLETSSDVSVEVALARAEKHSILAKMYKSKDNTELLEDGVRAIKCNYLGISFNNENYNKNYILRNYKNEKERYIGKNIDGNLLLVSGCYPPIETVAQINLELEDRKKKEVIKKSVPNFSNFKMNTNIWNDDENRNKTSEPKVKEVAKEESNTKSKKKRYNRDLFKM
jgi:cell division GTPase FtsZ